MRALQLAGGRLEGAVDYLLKLDGGTKNSYTKLIRKPSIERELGLLRGSPALDSGAGSSRSDSPRLSELHPPVSRQYSPSNFGEPPPPPPPRNTPPPPPPHAIYQSVQSVPVPVPSNVQQMFKRMPPAPVVPARAPPAVPVYNSNAAQQRGTSPVSTTGSAGSVAGGRQPMVVQNSPQVQQQLTQQMQALNLYQTTSSSGSEPPPPYPTPTGAPPPPPSYSASIQNRQSPTQDFRKSPSSGIYSGSTSAGSPSPVPVSAQSPSTMARPTPLQAWGARQAKTQPPIIMQSVKSTQVQKPVLQTATAPQVPAPVANTSTSTSAPIQDGGQVPPPSYTASIQQKQLAGSKPAAPLPSTEPPSYATTMQNKAKAHRAMALPPLPPPPYSDDGHSQASEGAVSPRGLGHPPLQRKFSPQVPSESGRSESPQSTSSCDGRPSPAYSNGDTGAPPLPPTGKRCS